MCMHWLKYVRLNRKDLLKNMRATTLEVAMLADVSGPTMRFLVLTVCYWTPLISAFVPSSLPLDVLDSDSSTKR